MMDNLYIKNYRNMEFIAEEDVYEYLKKLRNLIIRYNDLECYCNNELLDFDKNNNLQKWKYYVKELINELFNSFVLGQFICASAMTRSLIEACAYLTILVNEKSSELIEKSFLSSVMNTYKLFDDDSEYSGKFDEILKEYCKYQKIDYSEFIERYKNKSDNMWLSDLLNKKRVTFRDVCEYISQNYSEYYNYINAKDLYYDFRNSSNYVHAQSIQTKSGSFVFYEIIFAKLFDMSLYIFETISLFPINNDLFEEVTYLYYS